MNYHVHFDPTPDSEAQLAHRHRRMKVALQPFAGVLLAFAWSLPPMTAAQSQNREPLPNVRTVTSRSELKAVTPAEQKLAEFFDREGTVLMPGHGVGSSGSNMIAPPDSPDYHPTEIELLQRRLCRVIVVVGRIERPVIRFNRSETRLLTIAEVQVETWLRPASGPRVLTMGAVGGKVLIDGRTMTDSVDDGYAETAWPTERAYFTLKRVDQQLDAYYLQSVPTRIAGGPIDGGTVPHPVSGKPVTIRELSRQVSEMSPRCP